MKSEHTPIPDAELESDWLVLPRGRMKDEIKEARRLLRAVEEAGCPLCGARLGMTFHRASCELGRYLAATKGKEQP